MSSQKLPYSSKKELLNSLISISKQTAPLALAMSGMNPDAAFNTLKSSALFMFDMHRKSYPWLYGPFPRKKKKEMKKLITTYDSRLRNGPTSNIKVTAKISHVTLNGNK